MPDIRLTRIDNRLIHGQVATQWCGVVGANLLLVANDAVAADEFRQGLMNMAAPAYAQTRFFTIEKTINIIHKASANQHIAIICESPQDVLKLVEGGVPIKKLNIGNMHMAEGKRQVATSVAVDDDDVATFRSCRISVWNWKSNEFLIHRQKVQKNYSMIIKFYRLIGKE